MKEKRARSAEPARTLSRSYPRLLGEVLIVGVHQQEEQSLWAGMSNGQMQLESRLFWYQYIGDTGRQRGYDRW